MMRRLFVHGLCAWAGLGLTIFADDAIPPGPAVPPVDSTAVEPLPHPFLAPFRSARERKFAEADRNGDGLVNFQEFNAAAPLREAVVQNEWLAKTVLPRFRQLDANADQALELEELLHGVPGDQHSRLRQEFHAVDFQQDDRLTFEEYICLPSVASASKRGDVPDPVAEQAAQETDRALQTFHGVEDASPDGLPIQRWQAATAGQWYATYARQFDRDSDGLVTPEEIRTSIKIAYGLQSETGDVLRRENAQTFIWHTIMNVWDVNRDAKLSAEEFVPKFWRGPQAAEALFLQLDGDTDGFLSLAELLADEFGWTDQLGRFLSLDKDMDGRLSREDLAVALASYERPYLDHLFPAAAESPRPPLTFLQFRSTPLANPCLDWRSKRRDLSGDGRLSLAEFHPHRGLAFLGLSKVYFEFLDRNQDGTLDLGEFRFDVDASKLPPQDLFKSLDRDGDGSLTFEEAFSSAAAGSGPDATIDLVHPQHRRAFEAADGDANGRLDHAEFSSHPPLARAIAAAAYLQQSVQPQFLRKDANRDGRLSREEHLQGVPADKRAAAAYDFKLCDFDHDGHLSWQEFTCLPSVSSIQNRGPVPDPIVGEFERTLSGVLQSLRTNGAPIQRASQQISEAVFGLSSGDVARWDSDQNGTLTPAEATRGLELAFGIRHPDGTPLRRETGEVFDWRTFRTYNAADNGLLSQAEFMARYWAGPQKARVLFDAADQNGDGRLTVAELGSGQLLWVDSLQTFKKFDKDRNATISLTELQTVAASWEQAYIPMSIPGCDSDGDGALSWMEFRATPFANPLADWNTRRVDADHDGRLSIEEFHDSRDYTLKGLSGLYFRMLDHNQDQVLTVHEFDFGVDVRRISESVAFDVLDADQNGRVTLKELVEFGRPNTTKSDVLRRFHDKAARLEEAFVAADQDESKDLTFAEFSAKETAVSGILSGSVNNIPSARRLASQSRARAAADVAAGGITSWRMILLVVCNVLLLGGVGWFVLRAPPKP